MPISMLRYQEEMKVTDPTPEVEALQALPQERKSIDIMVRELNAVREYDGKNFRHIKSGANYQLMFCCFSERTNELKAVFCLLSMPRLKFEMPMALFLESFEPGHG